MLVVEDITYEVEPPPHPDNFVDAVFYIKLKAPLRVIFISGWGVFIQQYHFNELDDRMYKLEKGKHEQVRVRNSRVIRR